jgi:3-phosphoshikimate 1-carboxyvinyltransferase
VADIRARFSPLTGIVVDPARAADMIDEYPILAVAASVAMGDTVMNGIHELRVKESDRIAATVALLRGNGVQIEDHHDGMTVTGRGGGGVPGGGTVTTHHDHRIAMSALVLGCVADAPVAVDDASMIATSYPDFFDHMRGLGATIGPI